MPVIHRGMKKNLELSVWDEHQKRKTERMGTGILLAFSLFIAIVCTPVNLYVISDILLADTVIPVILDLLLYLLRFVFYWTAFAFTLHFACFYTWKGSLRFFAIYTGCAALRCVLSLVSGSVMTNDWQNFGWDMLDVLFEVIADAVQIMLVLLIFVLLAERKRNSEKRPILEPHFFGFRNPFNLTVLLVAFIPSVLQLVSRIIIYDSFFGSPQSKADFIWMAVYYMLDIISFVAGYLVIYLIVFRLQIAHQEAEPYDN